MCALISIAASFVAIHYGAPAMLFALLLGMSFNFLRDDIRFVPGIQFASRTILRLGVGLIGIRLTVSDIGAFGFAPIILVIAAVSLTILIGVIIGRILSLDRNFAILSGGATAICGVSAALAIASVLPRTKTSEQETSVVVIGVTTFSTMAMVAYPILTQIIGFNDHQAGLFLGATIHDVAQVVGAGYSVSDETGDTATYVKLLRVALLLPVIVGLSAILYAERWHKDASPGTSGARPPLIPWFLLLFIASILVASFVPIPQEILGQITALSQWALIAAVAGIGLKTTFKTIIEMSPRAMVLLVVETGFIALLAVVAILAFIPHNTNGWNMVSY